MIIFSWIRAYWYSRLRGIDLQILWPACKSKMPDLVHAKAAFAVHAYNDKAWMILGADKVTQFIDSLI